MIYCKCNFFSKILKNPVDVNILLPSLSNVEIINKNLHEIYKKDEKFKVLYLLHGALDDYTGWMRNTNIERYGEEKNIAIIMPSGQNSFYTNMLHGLDYYDFIVEELPLFIQSIFNVSNKREDNFIAGLSMGGYGASKAALLNPHKYGAFASLSGAIDPMTLEGEMKKIGFDFFRYDNIFGGVEKILNTENDLYYLGEKIKEANLKPRSFIACAIDDKINYPMNTKFRDILIKSQVDVTFVDGYGGHTWEYWDKIIKEVIDWL